MKWPFLLWIMIVRVCAGTNLDQCSCYFFISEEKSRHFADELGFCRPKNYSLISIETVEEWKFIKSQLENKKTDDGTNEWFIGLEKKNGVWEWETGSHLTYNVTWIGMKESKNLTYPLYGVINKKGSFNTITGIKNKGTICERKANGTSESCKVRWCQPLITTPTPMFNTNQTNQSTSPEYTKHQDDPTRHTEPKLGSTDRPTLLQATTNRCAGLSTVTIVIYAILSIIILVLCVIVITLLLLYKKKNSRQTRRHESSRTSNEEPIESNYAQVDNDVIVLNGLNQDNRDEQTDACAIPSTGKDSNSACVSTPTSQFEYDNVSMETTETNARKDAFGSKTGSTTVSMETTVKDSDITMETVYETIKVFAIENINDIVSMETAAKYDNAFPMKTGNATVDMNLPNRAEISMTTGLPSNANSDVTGDIEAGYAIPFDTIKVHNSGMSNTDIAPEICYDSVDITTNLCSGKREVLSSSKVQPSIPAVSTDTDIKGDIAVLPDPNVHYAVVDKTKKTKHKNKQQQTDEQSDRQTDEQTDRQTDVQSDKQTDEQTDKQTDE